VVDILSDNADGIVTAETVEALPWLWRDVVILSTGGARASACSDRLSVAGFGFGGKQAAEGVGAVFPDGPTMSVKPHSLTRSSTK